MNDKNAILNKTDYSNDIENNDNQRINNNEQRNYGKTNLDNQFSEFENHGYDLNHDYFDQYNIGYDLNNDYWEANNNQKALNNEKYYNGSLSTHYDNGNVYYNNDNNSNALYTENNFLKSNSIQNTLNEKVVSRRYFNLNAPYYKIRNLSASIKSKKNEKPIASLINLNFDIFPKDHIVLLSDNKKYVTLFLNMMKNNVNKSSGFIFNNKNKSLNSKGTNNKNKSLSSKSEDIEVIPTDIYQGQKINCEKDNLSKDSFLDINYEKIIKFKKKPIKIFLSKILSYYKKKYDEKVLLYFFDNFKLVNILDKNIQALNIFEKNRFFLLCNILVGKQIIYINDISNDLNLNEKIKFDRFLNNYFADKNTILFITCNDLTEIKILSNRALVFSHDLLKCDDYFTNIMDYYESIDDYIILNTKN